MKLMSILLGAVLGLAAGAAAAFFAAGMFGSGTRFGDQINVGGWKSDWTIGSDTANPWTRARVARHGLLALTKEEAVYFTAATDSEGRRLSDACTYEVSGTTMPGLWWSVTVYDEESRLPLNTDGALSFDKTKAEEDGAGNAWSVTVSPTPPGSGHWISSRAGGAFDMTLRIYKPSPELIADPEGVLQAPTVTRISCGGAA